MFCTITPRARERRFVVPWRASGLGEVRPDRLRRPLEDHLRDQGGGVVGWDVAAARQAEPARLRRQLVPVARLAPEEQPVSLPEGDRHGNGY
jgi:hypothetical protein